MGMMTDNDVRVGIADFEVRKSEDGKVALVGYAIKFNTTSTGIRSFVEVVDRHALDDTDLSEVLALINHDYNQVLGKNGVNMNLTIDEVGLRFEITPNNTTYVNDLIENMRSNLIDKCSFGFTVKEDKWERTDDDVIMRTILKFEKLYEISIVTLPAYGDTEAKLSARSVEKMEKALNPSDEYRKQLLDIELELYK